jgi:hypothetical protein
MAPPMNSLIVPRWSRDHRDHAREIAVEEPDHRLRPEALRQRGEGAQVGHQDGHRPHVAAEPERLTVLQAALGDVRAHVAAQDLPDEVAVAEPLHHVAQRPGERTDLVPAVRDDPDVEVTVADARGLGAQRAQGPPDPARQGDARHGEQERRRQAWPCAGPERRSDR